MKLKSDLEETDAEGSECELKNTLNWKGDFKNWAGHERSERKLFSRIKRMAKIWGSIIVVEEISIIRDLYEKAAKELKKVFSFK